MITMYDCDIWFFVKPIALSILISILLDWMILRKIVINAKVDKERMMILITNKTIVSTS